jgi:hypothetical protein
MPTEIIGENTGDDYSGVEDSYLDMNNPNDNPDTSAQIRISWFSATLRYMGIIIFTGLTNISSLASVSSATMYLYPHNDGSAISYSARRLLVDVVINQVTWNIFSTGNNWTTAGGLSDGNDRVSAAEGTDTFTGGVQQYEGMSGLETVVEDWIDGTYSNYGFHIQSTATGSGDPFRHAVSSEGTDGQRPYLSVTYTVSSGLSIPVAMNHYRQQGMT